MLACSHVETPTMVFTRYLPVYSEHFVPHAGFLKQTRGIHDTHTGKFHPRPQYNDIDIASLVRWMNARERGM